MTGLALIACINTAALADDGRVNFQKDIYDRDRAVSEGLKTPFRLELPRA